MELLYHYVWKHKMERRPLKLCDGRTLTVEYPGRHNDDAGPDFTGARLLIDGERWAGNVEIHVKASDWYAHGHDRDRAYDSVILHVVGINDKKVYRPDGSLIPQYLLLLPENFYLTYAQLNSDLRGTRCRNLIPQLPRLVVTDWLETLSMERLYFKSQRLIDYRDQLNSDHEQAVFTLLARGLGFSLNGLPFEMLAKNLPLKIIYHHADDLLQVEALLLGQAGFLNPEMYPYEEYYQALCREYLFLARKYNLRPMRRDIWKYSRTRPQNFPHRRIALLAQALHTGTRFSSGLLEADADIDRLMDFFDWRLDGYWGTHCGFGADGGEKVMPRTLSAASKELLIINVAAPFYYAHARLTGDFELAERAASMLMKLKPERNTKIDSWHACGLKADDALRTQALLHLRDQYCDRNRCLECRFGHYFLRGAAEAPRFDYNRIEENTFIEVEDEE